MPAGDRKLTMEEMGRPLPEAHLHAPKHPIVVVLDDLRSRHNVGSIFRSADAFGIERLLLCGFTPLPPHREIDKTALGATLSVPWAHRKSTMEAIEELRHAGYRVIAVEQTLAAVPITELAAMDQPVALVLGNELNGVADEVITACDACTFIPQMGSKHSLNVAVCAGVAMWNATLSR
ncbi:MAG: RNA methyltransferase [Flavobacteriales bacterium]|nr:RNA methyltransferase [Flavobacteriales bacterium]